MPGEISYAITRDSRIPSSGPSPVEVQPESELASKMSTRT